MKKLCLLLVAITSASIFAFEPPPPRPHRGERPLPPPHGERGRAPRGFMKSHGIWMAFNDLSAEERQAMLKLQREDPEKFKAEMTKKSEEFFKAEKARREELKRLVDEFRNAKDDAKEELKNKIAYLVRQNFKRRLNRSRIQLEELQERAKKLEQELDNREKAEDKIVAAVVENMLNGQKPERPDGPRRGPGKFTPKAPLLAE